MEELKKILKRYFTIIIIILVLLGLLSNKDHLTGIFSFWFKILTPVFYGIFIAYILSPLETKLRKCFHFKKENKNKILAITIIYVIFLTLIFGLFALCIPQIINSISELITKIPPLYDNFTNFVSQYENKYNINLFNKESLINLLQKFSTTLSEILPNILTWFTNFFKTSFNLLVAIIISIYLVYEKENIKIAIKRICFAYLKEDKTKKIMETYKDCDYILSKFIMAKLLDSFIIGILCAILMICFKLDYVALISLLVGITNMIPYVGPFIGGIFGLLLLLITNPKGAFIFLILILCLQQFDGYILGPKIVGNKVGIKPLWIIISLLIGGALGGILGMFLATPIIAMILYLLNKDIDKRLEQNNKSEPS